MSVGLAWKAAEKSKEKLVNQKYATLFLSWMPFSLLNFEYMKIAILIYETIGLIVLWVPSFLKVSKFQKQIFLISFEPKKRKKLFFDFCPSL